MKNLIKERIDGIEIWDLLDGKISKISSNILTKLTQRLKEHLRGRYEEFYDFELKYEFYGHDGGVDFYILGERAETMEEAAQRVEKERNLEEAKEKKRKAKGAKELKKFQELKLKFEGKV